jgi:MFS family permease
MALFPRPPVFFGWRVAWAAFAAAIFSWGVSFYGPPVYLHAIQAERGWPVSVISAAITCHFLLGALGVTQLPRLHRRFGIAAVMRAGVVLSALGLLGWGMAAAPWQLFAATLLSGAGWSMTGAAALNLMLAPWFIRRRAAAIATAFNGASVGGVVFSPLWVALIGGFGFAAATAMVGATMVVAVWWLAGRFLGQSPAGMGLRPDGEAADAPPRPAPAPRRSLAARAWGDRRFATLAAGASIGLVAQIGLLAHLVSLLAPALGAQGAGFAMALATICAVTGRSLTGWLIGDADRRLALVANSAVQACGAMLLLASAGEQPVLALLGVVCFGIGLGNGNSLPALIAQQEFREDDVARVVALVTATYQGAYAFAPALFGLLREWSGGAVTVFAVACVLQLAGMAVLLLGRRARPPG